MKKTLAALGFAALSTLTFAATPAMEPDDHTAAFWDFSMQAKNRIQDQSGFGNDLAFKTGEKAPLPVVKSGEGTVFDGQGGFLETKPKESLRIAKGDFTIEIVFQCAPEMLKNGLVSYFLGNKSMSEKNSGFLLGYSAWQGRKFVFLYTQNGKACSFEAPLTEALVPGKWYTLMLVRKGDKLICSLDGKTLAETKASDPVNLIQKRSLRIGIYPVPWQRDKQGRLIVNGFQGMLRYIRISDIGRGK